MMARRLLLRGLRLGTLVILLGAVAARADVSAQLPEAGSDPRPPTVPAEESGPRPPDPRLLTIREMASLAEVYSVDVTKVVGKVERLRKNAVADRDLIKASCIDHLLPEMRMIRDALAPRFRSIAYRQEDFTARADFQVISPGMDRVRELLTEAEGCVGQAADSWNVFSIGTEVPSGPNTDSVADPPSPPVIVDRPSEASIYR